MLAQLQHFRVLDTALIQSCGYPVHLEHGAFAERYSSILIGDRGSSAKDGPKDVCEAILSHMNLTDYKIGNTQVKKLHAPKWLSRALLSVFYITFCKIRECAPPAPLNAPLSMGIAIYICAVAKHCSTHPSGFLEALALTPTGL